MVLNLLIDLCCYGRHKIGMREVEVLTEHFSKRLWFEYLFYSFRVPMSAVTHDRVRSKAYHACSK